MTSEDRNRRMKYGHDVPRWWIPEFNRTHNEDEEKQSVDTTSQRTEGASSSELPKLAKLQGVQQQLLEQQRRWAEHNISQATTASRKTEKSSSHDKYRLKRESRQLKQNEQKRLLNRDIRIAQWILAGLFTLLGGVAGGFIGLLIGTAIGLLVTSFRLKI